MKDILKHNIGAIAIIIIALIIYLNGCFKPTPPHETTTIIRDTIWVYHDSTFYSHPIVTTIIKPTTIPTQYLPDTNITKLKAQYEDLVTKYLSKSIVADTLHIDTLGTVDVTDTITQNDIVGRRWHYDIKERIITNTITHTIYPTPKNQVYIGGGVTISPSPSVHAGLLFKNKTNFIMQPSITYNLEQGKWGVQVSGFTLIKLHK